MNLKIWARGPIEHFSAEGRRRKSGWGDVEHLLLNHGLVEGKILGAGDAVLANFQKYLNNLA